MECTGTRLEVLDALQTVMIKSYDLASARRQRNPGERKLYAIKIRFNLFGLLCCFGDPTIQVNADVARYVTWGAIGGNALAVIANCMGLARI